MVGRLTPLLALLVLVVACASIRREAMKYARYGYIDKAGNTVIEAQFTGAMRFSGGLAAVRTESGKWSYIDKTGTLVIPPQFEAAEGFADARARVAVERDSWGYIDPAGRPLPTARFALEDLQDFAEGQAAVRVHDPTQFGTIERITMYSPTVGLRYIARNYAGRWGYIDKAGRTAIEPQFLEAGRFSEGLALVSVDEKVAGYVDPTGKMAIEPQFAIAHSFSDGLARVESKNDMLGFGWSYIDRSGKRVIRRTDLHGAYPFSEGLALFYMTPLP